jgi:hypothetical protein
LFNKYHTFIQISINQKEEESTIVIVCVKIVDSAVRISPFSMIDRLVKSALQTGWLSVESEGLLRQVIAMRSFQSTDLTAIEQLYAAVHEGLVKREAGDAHEVLPLPFLGSSVP